MKFPWSVVHFRQFSPTLHNIFVQEADFCPGLEGSTVCMDYPIRTISASLEKPHYFYAEPIRNPTLRIISPLRLWSVIAKAAYKDNMHNVSHQLHNPAPAATLISVVPAVSRQLLGVRVPLFANINFSIAISAEPPNRQSRHTLHCTP